MTYRIKYPVLRWLLRCLKGLGHIILVLIISSIAYSLLSIGLILLTRSLIDGAVSHQKAAVFHYATLWIVCFVIQFIMNLLFSATDDLLRTRLEVGLRKSVYQILLKKTYQEIRTLSMGEWMTRLFGDVRNVSNGIVLVFSTIFRNSVQLVAGIIALYLLQPHLVLVSVLGGILMGTMSFVLRKPLKTLFKEAQKAIAEVHSYLQETLQEIIVVKSFQVEQGVLKRHDELQDNYQEVLYRRRKLALFANGSVHFFFQIGRFLMMIWGAYAIYHGKLGYGTFVAMLQLMSQIVSPITSMSGIGSTLFTMMASVDRLMEVEELDSEVITGSDLQSKPLHFDQLIFDNVSFSYGEHRVHDHLSYSISAGERIALTGPSGIGKTSLFYLLLGIQVQDSGKIYIVSDHQSLEYGTLPIADFRDYFAYVPQGHGLFVGTIRDNVTFYQSHVSDEEIWKALEIACAASFVSQLENQLDYVIGENGQQLSEGQRQRLSLARAILDPAPILLLDEVTSALDEETEYQVLEQLSQLSHKTLLMITHRKAVLSICDREWQLSRPTQEALQEKGE